MDPTANLFTHERHATNFVNTSPTEALYGSPVLDLAFVALGVLEQGGLKLEMPEGASKEWLEFIKKNEPLANESISIPLADGVRLAQIGRQLLQLDSAGDIDPPLNVPRKNSITRVVEVVTKAEEQQAKRTARRRQRLLSKSQQKSDPK